MSILDSEEDLRLLYLTSVRASEQGLVTEVNYLLTNRVHY